jgi:hypothetical protein
MRARWEEVERDVASEAEFHDLVSAVRALGEPTLVFLTHKNGCCLVVGIGGAESVLTFVDEFDSTCHSLGDRDRTGTMVFRSRGERDEVLRELAVPEQRAIEAALEFFRTGNRPSGVEWEADW